ncbi:hypothetical protein DPMN_050380 [Dreissena polymorpha]|uniref:Uncharacterized protein n=1 Tax=Dreissena polymorpha TaxID=45954 RepID=A0A9D4CG11_DREPO|nr:hypothetical protein DPMN_050380 [Dreissena polymorpha]
MHRNVCSTSSSNLIYFLFQRVVKDMRTVSQNSQSYTTVSCLNSPGSMTSGAEDRDFDDLSRRF